MNVRMLLARLISQPDMEPDSPSKDWATQKGIILLFPGLLYVNMISRT
jgi:hypothetical protein